MQEEMYHMSAVNIHMEGQREVGTISGGGEGETDKEGQGCLLWLRGTGAFLPHRTSALWVFAS